MIAALHYLKYNVSLSYLMRIKENGCKAGGLRRIREGLEQSMKGMEREVTKDVLKGCY